MQIGEPELTADEVIISKDADCFFVEPVSRAPSRVAVLLTSAPLGRDFPRIAESNLLVDTDECSLQREAVRKSIRARSCSIMSLAWRCRSVRTSR